MYLGAHIGTSEGFAEAVRTGRSIGCEAIQIFSKSPQSWKGPPIRAEAAEEFRRELAEGTIRRTAIHHCYLTNLASPKPPIRAASRAAFLDELDRAEQLGVDLIIFHPGAHTGAGSAAGVALIAEALTSALGERPKGKAKLLLETAAGQGTTVGRSFSELLEVLDRVSPRERVAVAIDTCHLFASGVDFRTPESYGAAKDLIRETVGLRKVLAFHLNDSKSELGSHIDRHENIGRGKIGVDGFRGWLNDPTWARVPGFLETPLSDDGYSAYVEDLGTLRGLLGAPR